MCRGVSLTPFIAGNMLMFDEIRTHSAANDASFAHVRAYAIRPYTCSLKFKRISPKYIIKKLLFHHSLAAIYISFAAVRADAIRPDSCSMNFKYI